MAVQGGPLRDVNITGAPLEGVAGTPVGALTQPVVISAVQRITSVNYTNRFPTPPSAYGFLTTVDVEFPFDGVSQTISGALFPESDYLEPTTGQIWPRIG